MKKYLPFIMFILLWIAPQAHSLVSKENTLHGKRIMFYTPHLLNPRFFGFEFGFMAEKRLNGWDFNYNAFAKALVAEELYNIDTASELRAGMLGVKAGIILPTHSWFPFFLEFAFGFAKTAYHKDPWFGKQDDSVASADMFLLEAGAIYRVGDKFLLRINYQLNNVDYVAKKLFLSVGFNY